MHSRLVRTSITLVLAAAAASTWATEPLRLGTEGWVSWDTAAVDDAPAWCCFDDWKNASMGQARCDLDGKNFGYGSRNAAKTDTVRVFVKLQAGNATRVRALAPTCEVRTNSAVRHLGTQDAAASVAWLRDTLRSTGQTATGASGAEKELSTNLLAALALNRGDAALAALQEAANGGPLQRRKDAQFWIGQTRGEAGVTALKPLLSGDPDAGVRTHVAFAIAQSKSPQAPGLLAQQGESDSDPHVRSQAWFWLAKTEAQLAESAIFQALKKEPAAEVRRQAVFALSQLPAERAVKALINVAEQKSLAREDRKQAVFWLSQSESPQAATFLEKSLLSEAR